MKRMLNRLSGCSKWLLGLILMVSPTVSFSPATIFVKVKLEPMNGVLVWSLNGVDFSTSSQRDLRTTDKSTLFLPDWKNVPSGDYDAIATIYDSGGKSIGRDIKKIHIE